MEGKSAVHDIAAATVRAQRKARRPTVTLAAAFRELAKRAATGPDPKQAERLENLRFERAVGCLKDLNPPEKYKAEARLNRPPPEWWKGTAADRKAWEIVAETCKRLAAGYGILALLGGRGLGKTHLAWATLIEACRLTRSAKYVKAKRLFMNIRDTFGKSDKTVGGTLDAFIVPDILMIDELGELQAERDFEPQNLTYLVDERYDRRKATILVSNDDRETFIAKIGASIKSRIDERGKIYVINWPSFRDGHETL